MLSERGCMELNLRAKTNTSKKQTYLLIESEGRGYTVDNDQMIDFNYNNLKIRVNYFDDTKPTIKEMIVSVSFTDFSRFFIIISIISILLNIILLTGV